MRESRERKEEEYNIYTLITRTPLANTSAVTEQQSPMQALRNITPLAVWALVRRHRLPRPEKTLEYCSKHVAQMKCYSCLCSLFVLFPPVLLFPRDSPGNLVTDLRYTRL